MTYTLEPLREQHRTAVVDIFNRFVVEGFAAYPDAAVGYDFFDRLVEMGRGHPAVAVRADRGDVVGFAMLRPHHFATTFARTAEVSYFILPEHTRRGIGTEILATFERHARANAIDSLLASISSRNPESLAFHLGHGFRECGRFVAIGRKFGEDFDVVWMQKRL